MAHTKLPGPTGDCELTLAVKSPKVGEKQQVEERRERKVIVGLGGGAWNFFCTFYFLQRKKTDFTGVFSSFQGQRSVTAAWATHSP